MTTQRVTRGFSIEDDGQDGQRSPRRVRTRQEIMSGEGKRPPAAVPLSALAHNPFNPREELTDIEETAASLRQRGQLQPVAVVRTAAFLAIHSDQKEQIGEAEYVVIDGNRRLASAHKAGLTELRIDVNDGLATSAADILESALIANVHRVDVRPIDQANAIQELVSVHGTQSEVAKRLGKTEGWVSQRLALLRLPDDLKDKVESGELPVREGRRIGRLPADRQHAEAEEVLTAAKAPRKARSKPTDGVDAGTDASAGPGNPLPRQDKGEHDSRPTAQDLYPVKTATSSAQSTDGPDGGSDPHFVDMRKVPRVPWRDGNAVAGLIFEKMNKEQRQVLLERIFEGMDEEQRTLVLERLMAVPSVS